MRRLFFIFLFIIVSCCAFISSSSVLTRIDHVSLQNRTEASDSSNSFDKQIHAGDLYKVNYGELALSRVYEVVDSNRTLILLELSLVTILLVFFIIYGILGIIFYSKTKSSWEKTSRYYPEDINRLFKDHIEEFKHLQKEINSIKSDSQQQISIIKTNEKHLDLYLNQIVKVFFQVAYSLTSQIENEHIAKDILNNLFHDFQIAKLYRISLESNKNSTTNSYEEEKFSVFAYFEENGTVEDIPHLSFVTQNDPNVHSRNRASEIIGHIKERNL